MTYSRQTEHERVERVVSRAARTAGDTLVRSSFRASVPASSRVSITSGVTPWSPTDDFLVN